MKLSFKTFCASLVLLYAGDVIAIYGGSSSYSDDRERSSVREKDSRSRSGSRSRGSSRDGDVDARKNAVKEMSWDEYVNDRPRGDIVITDKKLQIKFDELKFINEKISFSNLTKLSIADSFGLRLSDLSSDEDSDDSVRDENNKNYKILKDMLYKFSDKFSNLTELTIRDLKEIPKQIAKLKSLTKLDLHGNGLKELPNTIGNLRNLTELNLADNELTKLPATMQSLTNLKELNLAKNKMINSIYKIPSGVLSHLQKLELVVLTDEYGRTQKYDKPKLASRENMTWIDYTYYRPTGSVSIQDESLKFGRYGRFNEYGLNLDDILFVNERLSFPQLTSLSIRGESWSSEYEKSLSILLSKLPNLRELTIYNESLTELPKKIGKLINLKELDISAINLTKLPNEIGNLENLKKLKISTRVLTELPEEIGKLANLEELDISATNLTKLPNEIGNLENLKRLTISSEVLTELPKEIGKLINLEFLDLSGTKLTKLSEEIGNLTNLRYLYLVDTELTEFPKEMRKLINLKDLNLKNNKVFDSIEKIPDEILDLPNLNSVRWGDEEKETEDEKERRKREQIKKEEKRREDEKNEKQWNKWTEDLQKSVKKSYPRGKKYSDSQEVNFSLQTPLADWPVLRKFDYEGEENYYNDETWDKTKTLAENQKALVDKFIRECCDFSAKKSDYFGSREQKDIIAIDNAKKYKNKFINLFSKIVEDPVGCEFLRVILTKKVVNNLGKLMFVPVEATSNGSPAMLYSREIKSMLGLIKDQFIVFSLEFLTGSFNNADKSGYEIGRNNESRELLIKKEEEHYADVTLIHEMLHASHKNREKATKSVDTIDQRMDKYVDLIEKKDQLVTSDDFWEYWRLIKSQYSNDEEYHTIYGLTEKGWDPINESSYSAHRYKRIKLNHRSMSAESIQKIKTMRENGVFDENLYEFYLSPEFKKRCPKFGIGDFECSDFDSKTGKKLTSAK